MDTCLYYGMFVLHSPVNSAGCQLLCAACLTSLVVLEDMRARKKSVERKIPNLGAIIKHSLCATFDAQSKERRF